MRLARFYDLAHRWFHSIRLYCSTGGYIHGTFYDRHSARSLYNESIRLSRAIVLTTFYSFCSVGIVQAQIVGQPSALSTKASEAKSIFSQNRGASDTISAEQLGISGHEGGVTNGYLQRSDTPKAQNTQKEGTTTNQAVPEPAPRYSSPNSTKLIKQLEDKGCTQYALTATNFAKSHTEEQTVDLAKQLLNSTPCE
jgi:hypothetical protein